MIFCCTKKLLTLLGLKTKDLSQPPLQEIPDMAEWYGNLFFLDRRKCLIVTHARTLYTGLLFDVDTRRPSLPRSARSAAP